MSDLVGLGDLLKWLATTATNAWGAFALVVMLLGVMLWRSESRNRAKDVQIGKQLAEISSLQAIRIEDAREMIRVARSGTETMMARSIGDADFRDLMRQLVERVELMRQLLGLQIPPGSTALMLPPPVSTIVATGTTPNPARTPGLP